MNQPTPPALCLHCELAPQANSYRLCKRCARKRGLRHVYKKRKGWSPEWDAHLQELVERAKKGLPLFPAGQTAELPARPRFPDLANRNRRSRNRKCHTTRKEKTDESVA